MMGMAMKRVPLNRQPVRPLLLLHRLLSRRPHRRHLSQPRLAKHQSNLLHHIFQYDLQFNHPPITSLLPTTKSYIFLAPTVNSIKIITASSTTCRISSALFLLSLRKPTQTSTRFCFSALPTHIIAMHGLSRSKSSPSQRHCHRHRDHRSLRSPLSELNNVWFCPPTLVSAAPPLPARQPPCPNLAKSL